jgi:hypothetical protein
VSHLATKVALRMARCVNVCDTNVESYLSLTVTLCLYRMAVRYMSATTLCQLLTITRHDTSLG